MDLLCREEDDHVRHAMRWVVALSDGSTVYADDGRPGLPPGRESAWLRLRDHCLGRGLWVAAMRLQFRSNSVHLPPDEAGYFFVKNAFGVWGQAESHEAYVAGVLRDGALHVGRWKVPELTLLNTETRALDDRTRTLLIARPGVADFPDLRYDDGRSG